MYKPPTNRFGDNMQRKHVKRGSRPVKCLSATTSVSFQSKGSFFFQSHTNMSDSIRRAYKWAFGVDFELDRYMPFGEIVWSHHYDNDKPYARVCVIEGYFSLPMKGVSFAVCDLALDDKRATICSVAVLAEDEGTEKMSCILFLYTGTPGTSVDEWGAFAYAFGNTFLNKISASEVGLFATRIHCETQIQGLNGVDVSTSYAKISRKRNKSVLKGSCDVCGKIASKENPMQKCGRCKTVYYCSKECQ